MTLLESRETHSWQEAIDLGPQLVSLAEALPSHESTGLVMTLQNLMVELPAMIGHDLVRGGEARFAPAFRLATALEIIERVYPALDAAAVRGSLDKLCERLAGSGFEERVAAPSAAPVADPHTEPELTSVTVTSEPEESTAHVQPDSVQ